MPKGFIKIILVSLLLFTPLVSHAGIVDDFLDWFLHPRFQQEKVIGAGDINAREWRLDRGTKLLVTNSQTDQVLISGEGVTSTTTTATLELDGSFAMIDEGAGCAEFDADGFLTSTGTACGSGSGGGAAWEENTTNVLTPTNTAAGIFVQASSTFAANVTTTGSFMAGDTLFVQSDTGRVGINTSTPVYELQINDPNSSVSIRSEAADGDSSYLRILEGSTDTVEYGGLIEYDGANNRFEIGTIAGSVSVDAAVTRAIIIPRGASTVGIVDLTPDAQLDVEASTASTIGLIVQGASSQTANLLQLNNDSGALLSAFTADGGLLINISSTTALEVQNGSGSSVFVVNTTGGGTVTTGSATTTGTHHFGQVELNGSYIDDFVGDATISLQSGNLRVVDVNCTDCLGTTEIADSYVLNTGDTITTGDLVLSSIDLDLSGASADIKSSDEIDLYPGNQTSRGFRIADGTTNTTISATGGSLLNVNDNLQISGNASTTGYLVVGTTHPSLNLSAGDVWTGSATTTHLAVSTLTDCDTIDTDSNGTFTCGTDDAGSAGDPDWPFGADQSFILPSSTVGIIVSASSTITDLTINTATTSLVHVFGTDAAGDAKLEFVDGGGATDWSVGLDDGDSDKFVISDGAALGTNNAIEIDGSRNATSTTESGGRFVFTDGTHGLRIIPGATTTLEFF